MSTAPPTALPPSMRHRMILVASCFALALCAVSLRVYYLQTVSQEDLLKRATPVERELTFTPRRGQIIDREGDQLAVSVRAPSIAARPKAMEDRAAIARALAPLVELPEQELLQRLDPAKSYVWIKRQIHPQTAEAIRALKLPGILIEEEYKRFYPQGALAGQVLGFVGVDGRGLDGLERALEKQLAGERAQITAQRDARGGFMLTGETPRFAQFEGQTIQLTLHNHIQRVAEEALKEQVDKFSAKGGYAIVMDARSGEILAMANTPAFDPNDFSQHEPADWRLRPITDTFEPGSVIKPLVLAAAMQERTVKLDTPFACEQGRLKIGRYTIRDTHAHDTLSAAQVVQVSSNICSYKMAQTMGRETYHNYLRAFGFGQRSGMPTHGEQPGLLWPPDRWAEVSFANIAFGQGLTATPLQTTAAIGAIANDGMLMRPRLIRAMRDRDGQVMEQPAPQLVRRVVSAEVARQTAWAMSLVTTKNGTARQAALEHFTVAGKTGTAQKVNPKTRRYDARMWVASFVGFFPAERPELVIAVMIDEPHRSHYGGVVAAPAFKKIAQASIQALGLLPLPESERFDLSLYSGELPAPDAAPGVAPKPAPLPMAQALLERVAPEVVDAVSDVATSEPPLDAPAMPDLAGLTSRQALLRARALGLTPQLSGWGRVIAQSPLPGEPIVEGATLALTLSPATERGLVAEEPASGASSN